MGLLEKLQSQGSLLTSNDGETPSKYEGISQYEKDLAVSQLDIDPKKLKKYDGASQYKKDLETSLLDLDPTKVSKYLDNLPG